MNGIARMSTTTLGRNGSGITRITPWSHREIRTRKRIICSSRHRWSGGLGILVIGRGGDNRLAAEWKVASRGLIKSRFAETRH